MHKDTKQDYEHFLKNLKIETHDVHAEYRLGRVLLCGKMRQVTQVLDGLGADDIYDMAIQVIYKTAKEDFDNGGMLEGFNRFCHLTTTYFDRLNGKNLHLDISNRDEIANIVNFSDEEKVPDEEETKVCIRMVKNRKHMRDMITKLYTAVDMVTHEDNGVDKALDYMRDVLLSHETEREKAEDISKFDFAGKMMDIVYEYNDKDKREQKTINMPWKKFQYIVGGFGAEELVIVSAKSGQGKSAFALNIAVEVGVTQRIPVLYINSELSNEQMVTRYLSYTAYLDSRKIREGKYADDKDETKVTEKVFEAITAASESYYKSELLFKRIPDLQLSNIEQAIRQDCADRQTRLIIVDYIGRMDITRAAGVKDLQEWQIMRLAANRLKTLAQKYHVCIIMVAQLTDDGALQGSKAMKNEADMWLSINRLKNPDDRYDNKRLEDIFPYNTFLNVEKARNVNDSALITFRYEGAMMRFCDTVDGIIDMVNRNAEYGEKYANQIFSKDEYETLMNIKKFRKRQV